MLFMPNVVFYIHLSNFNEKNPPLRTTKTELAENGYYKHIFEIRYNFVKNNDILVSLSTKYYWN